MKTVFVSTFCILLHLCFRRVVMSSRQFICFGVYSFLFFIEYISHHLSMSDTSDMMWRQMSTIGSGSVRGRWQWGMYDLQGSDHTKLLILKECKCAKLATLLLLKYSMQVAMVSMGHIDSVGQAIAGCKFSSSCPEEVLRPISEITCNKTHPLSLPSCICTVKQVNEA